MLDDTVIMDKTYKTIYVSFDSVFHDNQSTYYSSVREENSKWLFVPKDNTEEFLLYDFNINSGDTVSIQNPWAGDIDLIVFSADTVELSGSKHTQYKMGIHDPLSGNPMIMESWISGIGSTNGLFYSGFSYVDIGYDLLCFHEKDDLIYSKSQDGLCGCIKVGIDDKSQTSSIIAYPNPAGDCLYINKDKDQTVTIENLSGVEFIRTTANEIDISFLPDGIYLVNLHNENNSIDRSVKIIKK